MAARAVMRRDAWNRCDYCGRFISYDDFEDGEARAEVGTSYDGDEYVDYWHVACAEKEKAND
jgi:hypothetical protein